ncbi:MAG TPA: hydrogenase formation protein HypD [Proteobacteria bacterium]|nr:hydrogenase formation protein HypD [Pseudomonadota bacterium]
MKFIDEYRAPQMVKGLLSRIRKKAARLPRDITVMEVCGSHTTAIARFGIRELLPDNIRLLSGPGCPVCVTSSHEIDLALTLAQQPGVIFCSFGDLLRVPGSDGDSLEKIRAAGACVATVHSALEALSLAQNHAERQIIFMGIGFETTSPTVAAAILRAQKLKLSNFFLFACHKLMPPVMQSLLDAKEINIDGFLCPGHVATIIGARAFTFIGQQKKAAVVAGFEPTDILAALDLLLEELTEKPSPVRIQYQRAVTFAGNRKAQAIMAEVFQTVPAKWRGLGELSASGLGLRDEFIQFEALSRFSIENIPKSTMPSPCRCGDILRGLISPADCPLFGRRCTPANPAGPCMVSGEGSCAAAYHYQTPFQIHHQG